jgi:hypothetical protein
MENKKRWYEINELREDVGGRPESDPGYNDYKYELTSKDIPNKLKKKDVNGPDRMNQKWVRKFSGSYTRALETLENNYEELRKSGDVPLGSGAFEEWFITKANGRITVDDVESLGDDQANALLSNIFYNKPDALKNVLDRAALTLLFVKAFTNPIGEIEDVATYITMGWLHIGGQDKKKG